MRIEEVLQRYDIPYQVGGEHRHVREGWVGIDCPYCSPNSDKFKLGINTASRAVSCWTCGPQRLAAALVEVSGAPWREVLEAVGDIDRSRQLPPRGTGRLVLPKGVGPLGESHRRYLERRGFDPDLVSRLWKVGGIGLQVKLKWRLFIPIHSQGEVVSWTTRSISDGAESRYVKAEPEEERCPAKTLLYGEDHCRHSVLVLEGPLDVWKVGPGAVATLSTSYSKAQVRRIARYPRRAVCFDNEPAAQKRARRLCKTLKSFPGETSLVKLDAKDPGSAPERELGLLRKHFLED